MALIEFKNLPDKTTAINSNNLNYNFREIFNLVYPVGSVYMSTNSTSPATLFGGTWEQIKDVFLLGAGDTFSAGSVGGESEVTLTIDEMPRHNHSYSYNAQTTGISTMAIRLTDNSRVNIYTGTEDGYSGGGQPHNNMPPYLAVYMWKRIS